MSSPQKELNTVQGIAMPVVWLFLAYVVEAQWFVIAFFVVATGFVFADPVATKKRLGMLASSSAVGLMFYLESEEAWAFVLVTTLGMWLLFENDRAKPPKPLERTSDDGRRPNELNLPL